MSMMLGFSGDYGRDYFIPMPDAKWYEVLAVKLLAVFMVPKFLWMSIRRPDSNVFTKNKSKMTGKLNCGTPEAFVFKDVKDLSKKVGYTINDVVLASITTAMKSMTRSKGDDTSNITMVIPANIRFKFYPTRADIVLENKFSALPLMVPLTDGMKDSYGLIKQVTAPLKSSLPLVYASYAFSSLLTRLVPYFMP